MSTGSISEVRAELGQSEPTTAPSSPTTTSTPPTPAATRSSARRTSRSSSSSRPSSPSCEAALAAHRQRHLRHRRASPASRSTPSASRRCPTARTNIDARDGDALSVSAAACSRRPARRRVARHDEFDAVDARRAARRPARVRYGAEFAAVLDDAHGSGSTATSPPTATPPSLHDGDEVAVLPPSAAAQRPASSAR